VLVREFQRIDRDEPIRWRAVERIVQAAGLPVDCERWKEIRALWSTMAARNKPGVRRLEFAAFVNQKK
jgi:hypothetical protein